MDSPKCRYICRRSFYGNRSRGVGIVAVVLIIAMMSMIGAVITLLVASGAVAKMNDLMREKAFALVHAGLEYGLMRINDGADPNGTKNFGSGVFTVTYTSQTGNMTVSANVSAMQGSATQTFAIQGPTSQGMNNCLTVATSGAALANGNQRLQGITLQNTCNAIIATNQMTVSWSPAAAERMTSISIGGVQIYNNPGGVVSGTPVPITSTNIPSCSTVSLVVDFDSSMLSKNFTLVFGMTDGTSKSAFAQFVANNEAACLNVDMSAAAVGFTGFVRLLNGTLTNSCAAPISIRVDKMTVSWAPVAPARTMSQISMGGAVVWNGNVASGVQATLATPQTIAGGASLAQDYLNFSSDMRGYNYTIVYAMRDNTTKTVNANLYAATPNTCLNVINTNCAIGSPNTDVINEQWQNTCPQAIVIDRLRYAWTGGQRNATDLVVNGASVWPGGTLSSPADVNITNVSIPGSTTHIVTRYRFNKSMAGKKVNAQHFTFFPDASTYDVAPQYNCPP